MRTEFGGGSAKTRVASVVATSVAGDVGCGPDRSELRVIRDCPTWVGFEQRGNRVKRLRRLGLLLGPLVVVLMLANLSAGITPAMAARMTASTVYKSTEICPADATAITSMSVKITRGTTTINAINLAGVMPGDTVKVTFDLNDACTNYRVSLVAYKAPDASNNLDSLSKRVVSSSNSNLFGNSGGSLQVTVPSCYFALVFATGAGLTTMSATNNYGTRWIDGANGGTFACAGISSTQPTYYYDGNPTCSELGANFNETWDEYKIDNGPPANGTYTLAPGGFSVTITGSDGYTFNWTSTGTPIKGVFVKSTTGGNLYLGAAGGTFGANGVKSVGKPNGYQMYEISHVLFCFDPLPSTLSCPPGNSAITSYSFQIVRGSTTFTATDLNGVQQGDIVKAFFALAPGCENVRISIPSYETKYPYYDINTVDQQVYKPYSGDTGLFSYSQTSAQRMVQTLVPGCNFQVNFVYGSIIEHMTVNDLYGDRKIAWKNGGTTTCAWAITPTATSTPTKTATANMTQTGVARFAATQSTGGTQTAVANQTATSAAKTATVVGWTATAVANATGTVVAKTATTGANQTGTAAVLTATTSAQQTATAGPQQTGTSVAQTVTAAVQTASAVAGTMTSVANTTSTAKAILTATSVAQTATAGAQQTSTSAAQTGTASANQTATSAAATGTSVAQTATSVAGQPGTATAIAVTQTAVANQTGTTVAQTGTASANQTSTASAQQSSTAAAQQTATEGAHQTATTSANQTSTASAQQTATEGPHQTATTIANQTATTIANQTATVAAQKTATEGAHQTATTSANQTATASVQQTQEAATNTAVAALTETVIVQTQTAAAATETAGATQTAIAQATGTSVAATATFEAIPTSTSTPLPVGQLRIHKVDQDGHLLYGACFWVTNVSIGYDVTVCDDGGHGVDDEDPNDISPISGEIWSQANLVPGTYTVTENAEPEGYTGDLTAHEVVVPAGGIGEVTIVNTLNTTGGTDYHVFLWKINCTTMPESINPIAIAGGDLPDNCVMAPAGVTFSVTDSSGNVINSSVVTGSNGEATFSIATGVTSVIVTEQAGTNNGFGATGPITFNGLDCTCGHSDIVIVNLPG